MAQQVDRTRIENFNLFGEQGELPDVVHCETIEARSTLHDWEFAPHRHRRLHQVLLVRSGGGRANLDGQTRALAADTMVNVPANCVHAYSFHPGTEGWVVTLSSEILDELLQETEGLAPVLSRPDVAASTPDHKYLVEQIFMEFGKRDFARAHVLRALSALLLGHVARTLSDGAAHRDPGGAPNLRDRFERLLDEHFAQHLGVADYADRLAVSPTHLSRVLRQATGLSASRLIRERVVREARRHLAFTNLRVSEIAYLLGYIDPAYFARVFAQATGMSPTEFRAMVSAAE